MICKGQYVGIKVTLKAPNLAKFVSEHPVLNQFTDNGQRTILMVIGALSSIGLAAFCDRPWRWLGEFGVLMSSSVVILIAVDYMTAKPVISVQSNR